MLPETRSYNYPGIQRSIAVIKDTANSLHLTEEFSLPLKAFEGVPKMGPLGKSHKDSLRDAASNMICITGAQFNTGEETLAHHASDLTTLESLAVQIKDLIEYATLQDKKFSPAEALKLPTFLNTYFTIKYHKDTLLCVAYHLLEEIKRNSNDNFTFVEQPPTSPKQQNNSFLTKFCRLSKTLAQLASGASDKAPPDDPITGTELLEMPKP